MGERVTRKGNRAARFCHARVCKVRHANAGNVDCTPGSELNSATRIAEGKCVSQTYDVIVVGIGAMGGAACWQLARRGVRVLGLEQFEIGHALGSSHGQSRMIRLAYYEHPDYVPLLRRAYTLWDEAEAASGAKLLYRTGGVYMGPPGGEVVGGALSAARLHGLAHESLDRADIARRYPQFAVPDDYAAVYEPEAGFLVPERAIAVHARLAIEAGAELHGHEAVREWHADGAGVRVVTDKGEYRAARLVFAGGAWTGKLLPILAGKLAVTRQVLGWLAPRDPGPFRIERFGVWGVEQPDGSLAYGFPLLPEDVGLKLARHGRGRTTDADRVDRTITADDEREVRSIAERYLPGQTGPTLALKTCLYTNSPDGHFILDRLPGHANVVVACGFSGHGFKFTSVMGEVLADLATAGETPRPVGFLGLGRFGKP